MTLALVAGSLAALTVTYWAFSSDESVPWWAAPAASATLFVLIVAAMVTAPEPVPVVPGVTAVADGIQP